MRDRKGAGRIHRVAAVKCGEAEGAGSHRSQKAETLRSALGAPMTPAAIPPVPHTPVQLSLIICPHPPTPVPELPLSHKNKSTSSLPFVQTSPQPWAYSAQHWCCSVPHRMGGLCQEGMGGGRVSILSMPCSPYWSLAPRGQEPPQLSALDNPTLLPTWIPLGLEGALALRQPVLGMPAPRLPRWLEWRWLTFRFSEAEDGAERQYPREGGQGLPALPQRQRKPSSILFPIPCFGWKQRSQLLQYL